MTDAQCWAVLFGMLGLALFALALAKFVLRERRNDPRP